MIKSKEDYLRYLEADRKANGFIRRIPLPFGNDIWKFLITLRRYEYHLNCYKGFWRKIICAIDKIIWRRRSVRTGITIGPNSFKEGLTIYHYGCIVVNGTVRGGAYITLQSGVNIAENVKIGDNCYLAPGVKIGKDVLIPENCVIGYNSVVTKTLKYSNSTYVGAPAKRINGLGYVIDGVRRQL